MIKIKDLGDSMNKNEFVFIGYEEPRDENFEWWDIKKEDADVPYKECMKTLMIPFLKENGFLKYKQNAFVRLNDLKIVEHIGFQKERFGKRLFTVNLSLLPLYVESGFMNVNSSVRLGRLVCGEDVWWDFRNKEITEKNFKNMIDAMKLFMLPWFEKMRDKQNYLESIDEQFPSSTSIRNVVCFYLREGDKKAAIEYLDTMQSRLDERYLIHKKEMEQTVSNAIKNGAVVTETEYAYKIEYPNGLFRSVPKVKRGTEYEKNMISERDKYSKLCNSRIDFRQYFDEVMKREFEELKYPKKLMVL